MPNEEHLKKTPEFKGYKERIPHVIHFIWVGKPIPYRHLISILKLKDILRRSILTQGEIKQLKDTDFVIATRI